MNKKDEFREVSNKEAWEAMQELQKYMNWLEYYDKREPEDKIPSLQAIAWNYCSRVNMDEPKKYVNMMVQKFLERCRI